MLLIAFYAKDDQVLTLRLVFCSDWILRICHVFVGSIVDVSCSD